MDPDLKGPRNPNSHLKYWYIQTVEKRKSTKLLWSSYTIMYNHFSSSIFSKLAKLATLNMFYNHASAIQVKITKQNPKNDCRSCHSWWAMRRTSLTLCRSHTLITATDGQKWITGFGSVLLSFLLMWENTQTQSNLGRQGFFLTIPGSSYYLREIKAGTRSSWAHPIPDPKQREIGALRPLTQPTLFILPFPPQSQV